MTTLQSDVAAPNTSGLAVNNGDAFADLPIRDRLCRGAIAHFGRFGFDESMLEMSIANDVDVQTLTELFGSIEGLRAACDEYVTSSISSAKAEALSSRDPATWIQQIAHIDSLATVLGYLARSLLSRDEFGRAVIQQLTEDAYAYLETAVRAGTIKPSQDPRARGRFLTMTAGGGFLLYLQMHSTPTDMHAVLRDYTRDMIMPALELYSQGLMADDEKCGTFAVASDTSERPHRNQRVDAHDGK